MKGSNLANEACKTVRSQIIFTQICFKGWNFFIQYLTIELRRTTIGFNLFIKQSTRV